MFNSHTCCFVLTITANHLTISVTIFISGLLNVGDVIQWSKIFLKTKITTMCPLYGIQHETNGHTFISIL